MRLMRRLWQVGAMCLLATSAEAQVGVGYSLPEAYANAQSIAAWQEAGARVGRNLRILAERKLELSAELADARRAFWESSPDAPEHEALRTKYSELLEEKDFYHLFIHLSNKVLPMGAQSKITGMGDLVDAMSVVKMDGGIEPYAEDAFKWWGDGVYDGLANLSLEQAFAGSAKRYVEYVARRNFAELVFNNPRSPLNSEKTDEYMAGWLLATGNARTFDDAVREVGVMIGMVGREKFDEVVAQTRAFITIDAIRRSTVRHWLAMRRVDWLLTSHDPDLIAACLIKRQTAKDWATCLLALEARKKRLGADRVNEAVRAAIAAGPDCDCPVDLDAFKRAMRNVEIKDCVAERLGPMTTWADTMDVAVLRTDREASRRMVLEFLADAPEGTTPEGNYQSLVSVVSEPILLAAAHEQAAFGSAPIFGSVRADEQFPMPPEKDLLVLFTGFAACADDRSFAVAMLASTRPGPPMLRLVQAAQDFGKRAAEGGGEESMLRAAAEVRANLCTTLKGLYFVRDGEWTPADEEFSRRIGDKGAEEARALALARWAKVEEHKFAIHMAFDGDLAVRLVKESNPTASWSESRRLMKEITDRNAEYWRQILADLDHLAASGDDTKRQRVMENWRLLRKDIDRGYALLATDPPRYRTAAGETSALDEHIRSKGDLRVVLPELMALFDVKLGEQLRAEGEPVEPVAPGTTAVPPISQPASPESGPTPAPKEKQSSPSAESPRPRRRGR